MRLFLAGNRWIVYAIASIISALIIQPAQAQLPGIGITSVNQLNFYIICQVAAWMFWILIVLTTVFVLVAAYKYLKSGGDEEKVTSATRTITYAAVAIVVALLAKNFPLIIASIFPFSGGLTSC